MHIPGNHFDRLSVLAKSKCLPEKCMDQFLRIHFFQLLNLHGKTLVCYVIALLTAYIILAIVQFHSNSKLERCYEAGGLLRRLIIISTWRTSLHKIFSKTNIRIISICLCFPAFLIFFCFLAAFCWQTVMCFDIWLTFG